jgi:aminopeptidase N
MAGALRPTLSQLYDSLDPGPEYSPDAEQAAARSLRNTCLALLSRIEGPDRARAQFDAAGNMTDQIAAFTTLLWTRATRTSRRPSSTSGRTTAS